MSYILKDKDYLDLWKYFQDKATNVKGAMFNTITWIIGFAAALLGFIFVKVSDLDPNNAAVSLATIMILLSIAGLIICLYAFFALGESAKHIKNNWKYADRCLKDIKGLDKIIISDKVEEAEL